MSKTTNIIVAGLGGQGVLKASDIVAEAVFAAGFDVKKSEVHGMSQRGGSVSSEVRFGSDVASPMIPAGEADYMIAVSADQIEVCAAFLNENTVIIRDEDIPEEYRASRMMNIAMLGVLNRYLAFPEELWIDLIRENFSGTVAEENITAFRRAFEAK